MVLPRERKRAGAGGRLPDGRVLTAPRRTACRHLLLPKVNFLIYLVRNRGPGRFEGLVLRATLRHLLASRFRGGDGGEEGGGGGDGSRGGGIGCLDCQRAAKRAALTKPQRCSRFCGVLLHPPARPSTALLTWCHRSSRGRAARRARVRSGRELGVGGGVGGAPARSAPGR